MKFRIFVSALLALLVICTPASRAADASAAPRVVVLGTAQDGGIPQAGCHCDHCEIARHDPSRARRVASIAIHFPKSGHVYLVDATPDLPAQLERIRTFRVMPAGSSERNPVDGILLTHAHMGHYLGLAHFGFESMNSKEIPVWLSPKLAEFLRRNGPWSQLVKFRNVVLREFEPGKAFELEEGVSVTPIRVPHRDEYSDTMAFLIRGPNRALLYVPDTDAWDTWATPLPEVLSKVDVALLDATFYSPDELPGRDVTKIRHPLVTATMDLLEPLVKKGRLKVSFTHLNHSNPALDPKDPERRAIEERGFRVAEDGDEFGL